MENNSKPVIYFAPLQESTDFVYRKAHARHFAGIDKYFSPYILLQKDGLVKKSHLRDIAIENCPGYPLVPQFMAGNSSDFIFLAKHLGESGYEELNWNLGCPYPMVTNKGMGAGLLPNPDKIREILDQSIPKVKGRISVKLRAGLVSAAEILEVLPVLNDYPISEVIVHPRIARQLYSGTPDHDLFLQLQGLVRHPLVYNGDVVTREDFDIVQGKFDPLHTWMIGRGLLKNPFLARELRGEQFPGRMEKARILEDFHHEIVENYTAMLSGQGHLITRMTKFWEYFCFLFPNPHKSFKRVKKSVNLSKYEIAVRENFLQFRNEE
jgi:tRNA-dihydrouridine synthase